MKIAWIGTGVMGAPMALHLSKAGHHVNVYNRTYEKAKALEPQVQAFESLKDCINDADIIFTIVGYPKDVEEVFETIFEHAKPNATIVDMTTSSPTLAKQLAQKGSELGFSVLDAPVTGGDLGAINATLSIMVGGLEEAYTSLLPYFQLMGKTINYMGVSGSGQHAKLANQISIAGAIAGCAESLAYAHSKNLDLESMLNVIVGGSAASWQAANNGPKMISKDFKPGFYLKHFLKDLTLVMDEKDDLFLPTVEAVHKIYTTLETQGLADMGTQAIIEYYIK